MAESKLRELSMEFRFSHKSTSLSVILYHNFDVCKERCIGCAEVMLWLRHSDVAPVGRSDEMFAHFAVRRNITHAVNITAEGYITCPQGQTSFQTKSTSEEVLFVWSCYPDSNWGPHPYQGCALPTEP